MARLFQNVYPPVAQPVKMEGPVFSPTSATVLLAGGGPFVKVLMGSVSNRLTPATERPLARVHPPQCSAQFLVRAGSSSSTRPPPSMYAGTGPGAPSLPSPGVFQLANQQLVPPLSQSQLL